MKKLKKDIKDFLYGTYSFLVILLGAAWLFSGFGIFIILESIFGDLPLFVGILMLLFNIAVIFSRYVKWIINPWEILFKNVG